jgi:hypothetical protein
MSLQDMGQFLVYGVVCMSLFVFLGSKLFTVTMQGFGVLDGTYSILDSTSLTCLVGLFLAMTTAALPINAWALATQNSFTRKMLVKFTYLTTMCAGLVIAALYCGGTQLLTEAQKLRYLRVYALIGGHPSLAVQFALTLIGFLLVMLLGIIGTITVILVRKRVLVIFFGVIILVGVSVAAVFSAGLAGRLSATLCCWWVLRPIAFVLSSSIILFGIVIFTGRVGCLNREVQNYVPIAIT